MRNTREQSNYFTTVVWVILFLLTMMSVYADTVGLSGKHVMLMVLSIAMIKSQLIANYFMGLSKTRLLWRGIMFSYFLIVGGLIALAYLIGTD